MNNQTIIKTTIVVLLVVLILLLYGLFSGDDQASLQSGQATKPHQSEPEPSNSALNSDSLIADSSAAVNASAGKMAYDEDWCVAADDLTQLDFAYYQRELEIWKVSKGNIPVPDRTGFGPAISQHLVPYMELPYDALWRQVQDENVFAMMAALYSTNSNINNDHKRDVAERLVVKGHTGTALSYLVKIELVRAQIAYEKAGEINTDIKERIYKAIAYVEYGVKRFDLDATFSYLGYVSSKDFPSELKSLALGNNHRIAEYTHALEAYIDKIRNDENIILTAPDEPTKVAKHNFDSTLAYLYHEFGRELNNLKASLPANTSAMLEASECVKRANGE